MVGKAVAVKENNEWSTPQWLFDYFNKRYNFQVDLAANETNTKCPIFYSKEYPSSLSRPWNKIKGWCWCNPPYGRHLREWIIKANIEMKFGAKICMLIPASVGAAYWNQYIWNQVPFIYFIQGRVRFVNEDGTLREAPMFDSAVVVFDQTLPMKDYTYCIPISIKEMQDYVYPK